METSVMDLLLGFAFVAMILSPTIMRPLQRVRAHQRNHR